MQHTDISANPRKRENRVTFPKELSIRDTRLIERASELDHVERSRKLSKMARGNLTVKVVEARNLRQLNLSNEASPYVVVRLGNKVEKSPVVEGTSEPRFESTFEFKEVDSQNSKSVCIKVMNSEKVSGNRDIFGTYEIAIDEVLNMLPQNAPHWVTLNTRKGKAAGEISVHFQWVGDGFGGSSATKTTSSSVHQDASMVPVESPMDLAPLVDPESKTRFLRVTYYYDATKSVLSFSREVPVLGRVTRIGERTLNALLPKISSQVNSAEDLDAALVPFVHTVDYKVDSSVKSLIETLLVLQSRVIEYKDGSVERICQWKDESITTASSVKDKSVEQVSTIAATSVERVSALKQKSVETISSVATTSMERINSAKDLTVGTLFLVAKSGAEFIPYYGDSLKQKVDSYCRPPEPVC